MTIEYLKKAGKNPESEAGHARKTVEEMLAAIESRGEAAVREYAQKLDKWTGEIVVTPAEVERRTRDLPDSVKRDIEFATAQVRNFALAQRESMQEFSREISPGLTAGQRLIPVNVAGCFVSGINLNDKAILKQLVATITHLGIKLALGAELERGSLTWNDLRGRIQDEAERRDAAYRITAEGTRRPEQRSTQESGRAKPYHPAAPKAGNKERTDGPPYWPHAHCDYCKQQGHYARSKDGKPFCPALKASAAASPKADAKPTSSGREGAGGAGGAGAAGGAAAGAKRVAALPTHDTPPAGPYKSLTVSFPLHDHSGFVTAEVEAFCDTGSGANLINKTLIDSFATAGFPLATHNDDVTPGITTCSGDAIRCLGTIELRVQETPTRFTITDSLRLPYDILLGLDSLRDTSTQLTDLQGATHPFLSTALQEIAHGDKHASANFLALSLWESPCSHPPCFWPGSSPPADTPASSNPNPNPDRSPPVYATHCAAVNARYTDDDYNRCPLDDEVFNTLYKLHRSDLGCRGVYATYRAAKAGNQHGITLKHCATFLNFCPYCQKSRLHPSESWNRVPQLDAAPGQTVTIDFLGPIYADEPGPYKYILSMADHSGAIKDLLPTHAASADAACSGLRIFAARYGVWPDVTIQSDRGAAFTADVTQQLIRMAKGKWRGGVAYSHQDQTHGERLNKEIRRRLTELLYKNNNVNSTNWHEYVPELQAAIDTLPDSRTGISARQLTQPGAPRQGVTRETKGQSRGSRKIPGGRFDLL